MFTIKAEVRPGCGNGYLQVEPGRFRRIVGADCPVGGGCRSTGWYSVEEVHFASREECALALGGAIWCDGQENFDHAEEGEAILKHMGY